MHCLDNEKLPRHVAIIMDGNGRWAKTKNLPRIEGHVTGIESVRDIVTATRELGIPYLTLYAFSKENWVRPREEVQKLMGLLGVYLDKELPLLLEKGIRFKMIGEMKDFPKKLQEKMYSVMKKTAKNKDLTLNLALSYSGRQEILHAIVSLFEDVKKGSVKRINENVFKKYLYTGTIPDPDFLIRTSGEMRLSNFLLWQTAYTEIYVTKVLWPNFRKKHYLSALKEYTKRERRFGRVEEY
ncbi:MAG TPA: isoprenyl transferase [Syntrophorhabdus sp.]|nr:isoprenyl transferase [Syntrophorhabdus sp.]MDI9556912.1 isoprenyl transferase [Pseudomonadota bacterium]OPX94858.1 MAG: Ditrans,polycis-undecaprenyl-diphosphate synthase ((2E,6E)-farnesyl-diphosphate specific) [Syntrophorhabdus sp. PtaB.Bin027]OQB76498.1 MAG: Ditrans,polycis-undecaprenyl-diphosphate synthase ((2E,6E)-farnesyl-diphosphate specific) [Deltaproteobacteria bacterium ADurb.Bin135]MBP8745430.1 isoprenyl transferase [Syntrophorhabdus sp.]